MFDAQDPLFASRGQGDRIPSETLYDSTDASKTGTDISAVAGGDGEYPEFQSTTTDLSVFEPGQYIVSSSFSNGGNNGLFRVVESSERSLKLSGGLASSIVNEAAGQNVTIRRQRIVALAELRMQGNGGDLYTLQASSSSNLSGTVLQHSLDGITWDTTPDVALPDTEADNAKTIQFVMGQAALVRLGSVPSNFSGNIKVG